MSGRSIALVVLVMAALTANAASAGPAFRWLELEKHHVKWGESAAGTGAEVTYAFVTRSVHFDDARNCRGMQALDGLSARSAIGRPALEREAAAAFAMWQAVADIRFRRTDDPARAQILIGAQTTPRGVAFTDVAYEPEGDDDIRGIRRSLICLNPEKPWKVGFGGDLSVYDLRYAFAHEIGHAIGLDHPSPSGEVMSFKYDERFRALQSGDIAGAAALYGPHRGTVAGDAPAPVAPATREDASACDRAAGTTALAPRDSAC